MALMQYPRDKPLHYISPVVSERHATCETILSRGTCKLRVNGLVGFPLDSLYIRREKSLVFFDSEWCFRVDSQTLPIQHNMSHATHSLLWLLCGNCLLNCVIQFSVCVNDIHSHVQVQHCLSPPNGRLPGECVLYIKCT